MKQNHIFLKIITSANYTILSILVPKYFTAVWFHSINGISIKKSTPRDVRDTHRSNEAKLSPNTGLYLTARVTRVRQMTRRLKRMQIKDHEVHHSCCCLLQGSFIALGYCLHYQTHKKIVDLLALGSTIQRKIVYTIRNNPMNHDSNYCYIYL